MRKNLVEGTRNFLLPLNGKTVLVCKLYFLNTLVICERTYRTALEKLNETGVVEKEQQCIGRRPSMVEKDRLLRQRIKILSTRQQVPLCRISLTV